MLRLITLMYDVLIGSDIEESNWSDCVSPRKQLCDQVNNKFYYVLHDLNRVYL